MPRLVGIAGIAELLKISRQRADQLTRTRSFPEPVRRVAPLGHMTTEAIRELYDELGSVTFTDAIKVLEERAFDLPLHPRLWREWEVEEWARAEGRLAPVPDDPDPPASEGGTAGPS